MLRLVCRLHSKRPFSTGFDYKNVPTVDLAYDLWQPRGGADPVKSPIVFLHGLFGSKSNNRTVSKILARDLKKSVYCLDLRNHGESPHVRRHDYIAMAADVYKFIREHELKNPILIGHSMGARAAMGVALLYPQSKLEALIPVDNGPLTMALSPEFKRYIEGMRAVNKAKCSTQKEMSKVITPYAPDIPVQLFLLSNFRRDPIDDTFHCRLPLDTLGRSLDHIGDFDFFVPSKFRSTVPTLLIRGAKSGFVPDEALPLMGELFPKFETVDIDSGHWVISEKPQEFVDAVEHFLEKIND